MQYGLLFLKMVPNKKIQLDIIFENEKKTARLNRDEQIAKRLEAYHGEMLPIAHSLGGVAAKLTEYPMVRQWLYKRIRQGEMPIAAYRYFRSFISSC